MRPSSRSSSASSRSSSALALALGLLAGLGAGGCTAGAEVRADVAQGRTPGAVVEGVPFVAQEGALDCGATALAVVLAHAGRPADRAALERQVVRRRLGGSFTFDVALAVRRAGLEPWERAPASPDDLRAWIRAGRPPVVLLAIRPFNTGYRHFAVATGFDDAQRVILLHDGERADAPVALDDFEERWEAAGRWALVAVPPEARLPPGFALLDARARARLGLLADAAGETGEAIAHLEAAVALDPALAAARANLGRSLLVAGRAAEAERELRAALALAPEDPRVANNLACALLERRDRTGEALAEAEGLARAALAGASPDLAPAVADTLSQARAARGAAGAPVAP